jgi:hypothetical protein
LNPNAVISIAVILGIGLTLLIWRGHNQRQSVKTLVGASPPFRAGISDRPERGAALHEVGVLAMLTRLSRGRERAYKEDTRMKQAKSDNPSLENNARNETVDEIDEDAKVLQALQVYTDTISCEPPVEARLREVERELQVEIRVSEEVATEWTQALSPILHGDDPAAMKGVFQQFADWADTHKARVRGGKATVRS